MMCHGLLVILLKMNYRKGCTVFTVILFSNPLGATAENTQEKENRFQTSTQAFTHLLLGRRLFDLLLGK